MCRDSNGQFAKCEWEFVGYGTSVNVDCDGDNIHVQVDLICGNCGKETTTDYSWTVDA
jgi:hypothetical protein